MLVVDHIEYSFSDILLRNDLISNDIMTTITEKMPEPVGFLGSEGVYMLPHHASEIERLTKQHHFMATTTDGLLLAAATTAGNCPLKVLDAGCADGKYSLRAPEILIANSSVPSLIRGGLGTWLRSLYEKFPKRKLEFVGVDIGSALFPSTEAQDTDGITLHAHNVTAPFPSSWNNTFDVVHQRLLVWGLKTPDWPRAIANYKAVLKPGGYLHLVEIEFISKTAPHPSSRPQLQKQSKLQQWSTKEFGMDIDIAYKLPDLLKESGFEDVKLVQFDHGYGALARDPAQKDISAELWVECFRTVDTKMPRKLLS
jgi:SAM-dependent methyltransferase